MHTRSGTREQGDEAGTLAAGHYTDTAHWQQEQSALFRRWQARKSGQR